MQWMTSSPASPRNEASDQTEASTSASSAQQERFEIGRTANEAQTTKRSRLRTQLSVNDFVQVVRSLTVPTLARAPVPQVAGAVEQTRMTIALCRRSAEDEARRIPANVAKVPEPIDWRECNLPHRYGLGNRASVLPMSR